MGLHYQYVINNQFEIYLITWWNPAHKTSRRKKEINTEYMYWYKDRLQVRLSPCLYLFHNPILLLWQYNFIFFHIHIAQAINLSNSKEKMLNLYIFFLISVSIYKRMGLFALLSTDLFWNASDIKCGKSNYCSLCTVSFLHQQPLTSSSSCSPPDIIPCTVLLVYDSLSESHFHYHHYS